MFLRLCKTDCPESKATPGALPDFCELGSDGKVLILVRAQLQGETGGLHEVGVLQCDKVPG